jgi:hypothetical protein
MLHKALEEAATQAGAKIEFRGHEVYLQPPAE